jgi:hypothetical protein
VFFLFSVSSSSSSCSFPFSFSLPFFHSFFSGRSVLAIEPRNSHLLDMHSISWARLQYFWFLSFFFK